MKRFKSKTTKTLQNEDFEDDNLKQENPNENVIISENNSELLEVTPDIYENMDDISNNDESEKEDSAFQTFDDIKSVHEKLKPYKCNLCGKDFSQTSSLKQHVKSVHDKLKPYKCNKCGKSFSQLGNLKKHMDNRHKAGETTFK